MSKKDSEQFAKANQKAHQKSNKPPNVLIRELMRDINNLQKRLDNLDSLPAIWDRSTRSKLYDTNSQEQRLAVLNEGRQLLETIRLAVEKGTLKPLEDHGHETSVLMERILKLYSETPSTTDTHSSFDECQTVLSVMDAWKIDRQHLHVVYSITAATREGRWEDASNLFWSHIDPEDSGYRPYDEDVANPVGLYAVARFAQERNMPVIEPVMDSVLRMTMVSPFDQDKYLLAAGTAIGHVGEWEAFIKYLKNSFDASRLGQPLVAAVMKACIANDSSQQAMEIFDEFVVSKLSIAGEWQWAGGENPLHPLCRDLALQALGQSFEEGSSRRALDYYNQIAQEKYTISIDALVGVFEACVNDGQWPDAVDTLLSMIAKSPSDRWVVTTESLAIEVIEDSAAKSMDLLTRLGSCVEVTMRGCNSDGQFGVAMVCLRLFQIWMPADYLLPYQEAMSSKGHEHSENSLIEAIAPIICALNDADGVLSASMVALCGLGLNQEASNLFKLVEGILVYVDGKIEVDRLEQARDLVSYANEGAERFKPTKLHGGWEVSYRHIHRLTSACSILVHSKSCPSQEEMRLLSTAAAVAVRSCTVEKQADAGLVLLKWIEETLASHAASLRSHESALALPPTDALLSARMGAYLSIEDADAALELFQNEIKNSQGMTKWRLSTCEAITAFFRVGHASDAMDFFGKVVAENRSPDIFCRVAEGLVDEKDWDGVAKVYKSALSCGCLSEELSILAMKAAAAGRIDGRVRVFRNILGETAKFVGTQPLVWAVAKYWILKRAIGFPNICIVMWWNTSNPHLNEVELALKLSEQRKHSGLLAKTSALRTIVIAAAAFNEKMVPSEMQDQVQRIPGNREGWVELLNDILEQAKDTSLFTDPVFASNVAIALSRLERRDECVDFVTEALANGVNLQRRAVDEALKSASALGRETSVQDLKMLTMDTDR